MLIRVVQNYSSRAVAKALTYPFLRKAAHCCEEVEGAAIVSENCYRLNSGRRKASERANKRKDKIGRGATLAIIDYLLVFGGKIYSERPI